MLRRKRTDRRRCYPAKYYQVEDCAAATIAASSDFAIHVDAAGAGRECVDYLVEEKEGNHDEKNLDPELKVGATAGPTRGHNTKENAFAVLEKCCTT